MGDGDEESLNGLSRKQPSRLIANSHAEHQGSTTPNPFHRLLGRIYAGFGVQRVEDGLHQQGVYPTLYKYFHLLDIGIGKFVEGDGSQTWVLDIGTKRTALASRTDTTQYEARLVGSRVFVGGLACYAYSSKVDVTDQVFAMIIGERDALGVEGAGGDEVCPSLEVLFVNVADDVGLGQAEQVAQSLSLRDHCSHRTIETQQFRLR